MRGSIHAEATQMAPEAALTEEAAVAGGAADEGVPAETRVLAAAQAGDDDAFQELVGPYRRELQVHCYRMLGSIQDAEDLTQETLLAAWRGLAGFEGRASVRTWLYRIATNRCLNELRAGARRSRDMTEMRKQEAILPEPSRRRPEPSWLEPYPDALLDEVPDRAPGPEARYETRESVSLAFLTAIQQLPPNQRAVLVLRDALGFRAAEVSDILGITTVAVNSALRRARAGLEENEGVQRPDRESAPLPGSLQERRIVDGFTHAFETGDVDALVALLTEDALLTMPPLPLEYQGQAAIGDFLASVALREGRSYALRATRANGQPAFGAYARDWDSPVLHPHGVVVLTLAGDRIAAVTRFLDNVLMTSFGLPESLTAA